MYMLLKLYNVMIDVIFGFEMYVESDNCAFNCNA